mgnify:CR=1 FL=1
MASSALKRLIGKRAHHLLRDKRARLRVRQDFAADRRRYLRFMLPDDALASPNLAGRNLEAQVTKDYHRVEKGLALRSPKRPFGAEVARRLDLLMPTAERAAADGSMLFWDHAARARAALDEWNHGGNASIAVSPHPSTSSANTLDDVSEFFTTRHSVRDFDELRVSRETIEEAIRLAIQTPSVCNRQAWFARVYEDPSDIKSMLEFQNGNTGFGIVPVLALVTTDARMFAGPGERNQPWIEGGLFSMTLVWALHGLGLESCMLNMSQSSDQIDLLRDAANIPKHELVVMMIAIGHAREGHRVARSERRPVHEVLVEPDRLNVTGQVNGQNGAITKRQP